MEGLAYEDEQHTYAPFCPESSSKPLSRRRSKTSCTVGTLLALLIVFTTVAYVALSYMAYVMFFVGVFPSSSSSSSSMDVVPQEGFEVLVALGTKLAPNRTVEVLNSPCGGEQEMPSLPGNFRQVNLRHWI